MFSVYTIWTVLCKQLVKELSDYYCSVCKQPKVYYFRNFCGMSYGRLQKGEEDIRQEQMQILREFIAAREIAHHCRSNNYIYTHLHELGNYAFTIDLDKLPLVQRMFLENRYIFEAIAKHVRVKELLAEVRVYPSLEQFVVTKSGTDPELLKHLVEYLLSNEYYDRPRIFTDASKSADGRCGIGVYDEPSGIRIMMQLKLDTSIMTAETLAIKLAMQHIVDRGIRNAVLLTDSQPACLFLKKSRKSRSINSVANEILENAKKANVTIQWVPSHIGIEGNETADRLSKEALSTEFVLENDIFVNDAINYFEEKQARRINNWYQEYIRLKGKSLKQLFSGSEEEDPYWFMEQNYTQ
ncbi:uncharacterized protein LOC129775382 [Toxorhynchites rutilus septentrionalis]|uniref:uncharacterized protein LOC129775382 n=1 Tax=Toxorhynchites rutilus septentrionalis TaxID=329112 RepID=UPI002478CD06|nr:uncharacterized protein LOC129775382 [Toxorhynchites rutilus septentrionalis]XP_055636046.1 uncharacterized protein LOC129775382 [Toxorhynchites rutilus septentrionalis]XP_055636047.1 uncharacterized protein LOC129775382 [Toxorhynchites rutilus septentrionalis]